MSRFVLLSRCAITLLASAAACMMNSTARSQAPSARYRPPMASHAQYVEEQPYGDAGGYSPYEWQSPSEGYCECCGDGCYDDSGYGACYGGCGGQVCASDCCPSYGCAQECKPRQRCVLFADFLYLRVADADIAHAQQQDGIGGAGTVPYGTIGTLDIEHHPGFRVGGGVACGPCSGVMFSYSFFESDSFASLQPPVITGGGAVGSLVHHPGAAITASVGPVDATYEVDFQLADLMYKSLWTCNDRVALYQSVGVQLGHLEQDFSQTGIFSGGQQGTVDTFTSIDFDGGGLKAGLDAESRLGGCFSAYGRLNAAVMSGQFRSRYFLENSSTDTTLAEAIWKDNRIVPLIEYEAGLAWSSRHDRCRFVVGYTFSHWLNAVTTPVFIDAVQADNYVDIGDTITFDGLVSRFECRW